MSSFLYDGSEYYLKLKHAAALTAAGRAKIKDKNFAVQKKGDEDKYPVHDLAHARNALARVKQHGSPSEVVAVKRKVEDKYPALAERSEVIDKEKEARVHPFLLGTLGGGAAGGALGAGMGAAGATKETRKRDILGAGAIGAGLGALTGGIATSPFLAESISKRLKDKYRPEFIREGQEAARRMEDALYKAEKVVRDKERAAKAATKAEEALRAAQRQAAEKQQPSFTAKKVWDAATGRVKEVDVTPIMKLAMRRRLFKLAAIPIPAKGLQSAAQVIAKRQAAQAAAKPGLLQRAGGFLKKFHRNQAGGVATPKPAPQMGAPVKVRTVMTQYGPRSNYSAYTGTPMAKAASRVRLLKIANAQMGYGGMNVPKLPAPGAPRLGMSGGGGAMGGFMAQQPRTPKVTATGDTVQQTKTAMGTAGTVGIGAGVGAGAAMVSQLVRMSGKPEAAPLMELAEIEARTQFRGGDMSKSDAVKKQRAEAQLAGIAAAKESPGKAMAAAGGLGALSGAGIAASSLAGKHLYRALRRAR